MKLGDFFYSTEIGFKYRKYSTSKSKDIEI
jgi:hypothetical protein